jgi:glycosyltransferase involved in cell wall biosynthesis
MNRPLVSICIITYNHERFIGQCIEGVMSQIINFDIEIIVGDDFSKDNTAGILREMELRYPGKIKPIYHLANVGGVNNAYIHCFPKLSGKYVAICEGDDFWTDPYKLQKQVDFLEKNPEFSFCFHRVNNVDDQSKVIASQSPLEEPIYYNANDIFHISIPTLSVVFRRSFDIIPNEILKVQSCDTFLFGLLARHGKAADLGFIAASYRTHAGGVYSSQKLIDQVKQQIDTRKKMKQSPAFTLQHKEEISKEILKRKTMFVKYFLKKRQLVNSFKVAFA